MIGEVIYFALTGLVFIVQYALHSDWRSTPTGRSMMGFTAGLAGFMGALVWSIFSGADTVPLWVYALVFGVLNISATALLVMLFRAQRSSRRR